VRASLTLGFLIVYLVSVLSCAAQSPSGTISGLVVDPTGAVIADADIVIVNDATGVQYSGKTNSEGLYVVPNLPPGAYRLQVSKVGFKTIIKPDIVLNVQDALAITFTLPLGAISETLTVMGGTQLVNTQDASVSTVVDRQFVENLPLNGRSFNTLLQLTPGVVIAPVSGAVATGQFSISGQRTDANYFTIDGVSANFGITAALSAGQSGAGTSQAFSALGGTSSLVSVEALQEFRIETSSFAPEFGRAPGGQVVLTTRSGANDLHGGLYEYFRNNVLDANDWFANAAGKPRAEERHNDFGGWLGGPIHKDNTFFFISYEGARLRLPQTSVFQVPSESVRSSAPASLAPFFDAYPAANGPISSNGFTAQFTGVYSNQATLNAGSVRLDHKFSDRFSVFGRYNDAPSETVNRVNSLSTLETNAVNTETVTVGVTMAVNSHLWSSIRGNYSTQHSTVTDVLDSFAGAVPLNPSFFLGSLSSQSSLVEFQTFDTGFLSSGRIGGGETKQFNVADDVTATITTHQLRFGSDERTIFLDAAPSTLSFLFSSASVQNLLTTAEGTLSATTRKSSKLLTQAFSLYGQDNWKITPRLTLTYGLRWELSPAPTGRGTTTLASWENASSPANLALAPVGTDAWSTTFSNIAPRAGVAYKLTENGDFVLRAGWGIFYDAGLGQVATLATQFPNSAAETFHNVAVPVTNGSAFVPSISLTPPYPGAYGFVPNLKLPRSYQWNVALEKSLAGNQVITATYVGQAGRNLLRNAGYYQPNPDFSSFFYLTTNGAHSNYDALQLQYRKPLSDRLQAILNYTWSHSLDNSSNDVTSGANTISGAGDYASSDFDARQSFSGAVTFAVPTAGRTGVVAGVTKDWSLDLVVVARSGFPFNGENFVVSPVLGYAYIRPDRAPGQPYWIPNAAAGGGKSLNPSAFTAPPAGQQGTEGRNAIQGFGLTQADFSIARKFPITERVKLQFRTDAFNIVNHPNFANPQALVLLGGSQLRSTKMLNQGLGGLNPIFQEGGPRSLQLSLKLTF